LGSQSFQKFERLELGSFAFFERLDDASLQRGFPEVAKLVPASQLSAFDFQSTELYYSANAKSPGIKLVRPSRIERKSVHLTSLHGNLRSFKVLRKRSQVGSRK
jgi:hypothetical protein